MIMVLILSVLCRYPLSLPANSGSKHKHKKLPGLSCTINHLAHAFAPGNSGKTAVIVCLHQAKKEIGRFPVGDINPPAAARSSVSFVH
jgi:hypothetical protein